MNFEFKQKITEELILSKFSEETIMGFYLRVPIKKGLFRSPLRNDKNVTCSLYRNKKGRLIFKDFATGESLDCFNVVMTLYGCSYYEALNIIANDFGIVKNDRLVKNKGKINLNPVKIEDKEISKIQIEAQDFTETELKWWSKYGITSDILNKFEVYSCKHVFLNDQLFAKSQEHCPIFGYYGKKYQGFELWKIYFPKRREFRFIGNYPAKKLQGYDKLPKQGKLCVITKSLKDVMTLYSLGIPACAPNSETVIPSKAVINDLKSRFKYVVALWDNDRTGITFLNKFRKQYPELIYTWIPRKYNAKDISDFYKEFGRKETLNLIKQFILWVKQKNSSTRA